MKQAPGRFTAEQKKFIRNYVAAYTHARIFDNMDTFHDELWTAWEQEYMCEQEYWDKGHKVWTKEVFRKVSQLECPLMCNRDSDCNFAALR